MIYFLDELGNFSKANKKPIKFYTSKYTTKKRDGPGWTGMDRDGPGWTRMDRDGPGWTGMVDRDGQGWTTEDQTDSHSDVPRFGHQLNQSHIYCFLSEVKM